MFDFTGACFLVSSLTDYLIGKYGEADTKIILRDCAIWAGFRREKFTSAEIDVPCVVDVIVRKYGAAAEKELHASVIAH